VVYDGARWVADQNLRFTRFGQFWNDIHQSSQQAFRAWVEGHVPWLWNSVVKWCWTSRSLPSWAFWAFC